MLSGGAIASSAIAAILASSSLNNVFQTIYIKSRAERFNLSDRDSNGDGVTLSELQGMKRKELLQIFLSDRCKAPSNDEIDEIIVGEWDGLLLENNGLIMTSVTTFITNVLFGRNRTWKGKGFYPKTLDKNSKNARVSCNTLGLEESRRKSEYIGCNRFCGRSSGGGGHLETEHYFDYSLSRSMLDANNSLLLRYQNYQSSKLSLWTTMVDELRFLEVVVVDDMEGARAKRRNRPVRTEKVLLGMGSMGWSGGVWNCSPFLLRKA